MKPNPFNNSKEEKYVIRLFSILGENSFELKTPENNWPKDVLAHFNIKENNGSFHFQSSGQMNYHSRRSILMGWVQTPRSLFEIAIMQLENKCREILMKNAQRSKVPYIECLLFQYYDLS